MPARRLCRTRQPGDATAHALIDAHRRVRTRFGGRARLAVVAATVAVLGGCASSEAVAFDAVPVYVEDPASRAAGVDEHVTGLGRTLTSICSQDLLPVDIGFEPRALFRLRNGIVGNTDEVLRDAPGVFIWCSPDALSIRLYAPDGSEPVSVHVTGDLTEIVAVDPITPRSAGLNAIPATEAGPGAWQTEGGDGIVGIDLSGTAGGRLTVRAELGSEPLAPEQVFLGVRSVADGPEVTIHGR